MSDEDIKDSKEFERLMASRHAVDNSIIEYQNALVDYINKFTPAIDGVKKSPESVAIEVCYDSIHIIFSLIFRILKEMGYSDDGFVIFLDKCLEGEKKSILMGVYSDINQGRPENLN